MAEQLCPLDLSTKPLSGLAMKLPKSAPYNMPKTVIKVSMILHYCLSTFYTNIFFILKSLFPLKLSDASEDTHKN